MSFASFEIAYLPNNSGPVTIVCLPKYLKGLFLFHVSRHTQSNMITQQHELHGTFFGKNTILPPSVRSGLGGYSYLGLRGVSIFFRIVLALFHGPPHIKPSVFRDPLRPVFFFQNPPCRKYCFIPPRSCFGVNSNDMSKKLEITKHQHQYNKKIKLRITMTNVKYQPSLTSVCSHTAPSHLILVYMNIAVS